MRPSIHLSPCDANNPECRLSDKLCQHSGRLAFSSAAGVRGNTFLLRCYIKHFCAFSLLRILRNPPPTRRRASLPPNVSGGAHRKEFRPDKRKFKWNFRSAAHFFILYAYFSCRSVVKTAIFLGRNATCPHPQSVQCITLRAIHAHRPTSIISLIRSYQR